MRRTLLIGIIEIAICGCASHRVAHSPPLPTGHRLSISAQSTQDVGDYPMNLISSPDGRFVISSDMGNHESLWSINARTGQGVSHVDFPNKRPGESIGTGGENDTTEITAGSRKTNGLYYGLAISPDNTLYAAQGAHDSIAVLHLEKEGQLTPSGSIRTRRFDFPAGLALDSHGHLYVADNGVGNNTSYKTPGSVAIYNTAIRKPLGRYTFSATVAHTSNFPYGIAALADGSKCYVASERDDAVYVLNTKDPTHLILAAKLSTGAHPVAILLSADQHHLYVSNSLGDTVSVIDTHADKITDTIMLRPAMVRDIPGVTPLGLALSPDQKTLYVALADMDAIGVIDLNTDTLAGYIPAGWYPTSIALSPDGKRLLIANARGTKARNPNNKPDPDRIKPNIFVLDVLAGNVTAIKIPTGDALERSTEAVLHNDRLDTYAIDKANPLASLGLAAGKITHVIYIIKENRTYDQVFGDEPRGNGDPSLVQFGKHVTPNQHALAERFVLLDNLYASGEVSGDGWAWSTQGMADAYISRNVPYDYSHRGRRFDFEGMNNGYPTAGAPAELDGKPLATNPIFRNESKPIPNVTDTGNNIWDAARRAGISLRNYGFFLYFANSATGIVGGPDNYPCAPGLLPPGHDLAGITDIDYRRFDLTYADSDAPQIYYQRTGDPHCLFGTRTYGQYHLACRFDEWDREFELMLHKDPTGGAVPALMLIRLPNDHTEAAKSNSHTPRSYVADNDYAVGEIVQAVSHSPIWKHTAIFIIEDDAQNGSDHVDAHRTTGLVISPWIKTHSVDHHFYNTDSMLKTVELLLNLKPLSQFDAVADPIMDWNSSPQNDMQYDAILPAKELIAERNPSAKSLKKNDPRRRMALESDKMDFSHADAVPADELNEIVWKTIKGPMSKMPPPRGISDDDD
ncbi:MAG TPA: beta-propeller fold lactonase family protein [Tepidisphaeraceae bacterium]|nr:beta-propeller fold lactonase family protein [Tepidisphaeraceae bacterium]